MAVLVTTYLLVVTIPMWYSDEKPIFYTQPNFASQQECLAVGSNILANLGTSITVKEKKIKATCHVQQIYVSE